ncbi:MAG: hypothetical protein JNG89_00180 [Planctomycetaceae bacterium]|nr:hypothetical protein [Planctomycetaceae bacterium]
MSRCPTLLLALLLAAFPPLACGFAATPEGPLLPVPAEDAPAPESSAETGAFAWSTFLRDIADDTIPRDFEQREGWGDQTEIVTGVRVREKNGLPRISKRTKRVNHGTWRRIRLSLHRPDEKLRFSIRDVHKGEQGGLTFKVVLATRLRCTAQSEFWNYGVRTGSATVQADATVRMVARFDVTGHETDPDDDGWFVEVEYVPEVDRVRIELDDFDVRRVGHIDGDLADGLGDSVQPILAKILDSQAEKVTQRIQRELVERDSRVKLSLPRLMWDGAGTKSNQEPTDVREAELRGSAFPNRVRERGRRSGRSTLNAEP